MTRLILDPPLAEKETFSKPGTADVTASDLKKISPIVRHYAKMAHPFTSCVLPETPVDCPRDYERHPNGIPLCDLRQGDLVWTYNAEESVFELKPVKWAGPTRRDAALMRLELDSGAEIIATPDHRFMRRDGSWAELADLQPGDSLMPLYRTFTPKLKLRPDENAGWLDEHRVVLDEAFGEDRGGLHAHHVDERYCNTHPNNFELLTSSEHRKRHRETTAERFRRMGCIRQCADCGHNFQPVVAPQIRCSDCGDLRKFGGRLSLPYPCAGCGQDFVRGPTGGGREYCDSCNEERLSLKQAIGGVFPCAICEADFIKKHARHKYCSTKCRRKGAVQQQKTFEEKPLGGMLDCRQCKAPFIRTHGPQKFCSAECRKRFHSKTIRLCPTCSEEFEVTSKEGKRRFCSDECRDRYRSPKPEEAGFNHKIMAVEPLSYKRDVWDIEVEGNHNFVVHGVVLHNCKRDQLKHGLSEDHANRRCSVVKSLGMRTKEEVAEGIGWSTEQIDTFLAECHSELKIITASLGVEPLHESMTGGIAFMLLESQDADEGPDALMEVDLSAAGRKKMASSKTALPDGSFPIPNRDFLRRAIKAVGRAKDRDRAKAWIKKRARALGATSTLPSNWKTAEAESELYLMAEEAACAIAIFESLPEKVGEAYNPPSWVLPKQARQPGFKPLKPPKQGSGSSGYDEKKHPRGAGGEWIAKGQSGPAVSGIQKRLGIKTTGTYDKNTVARVRAYQEAHNLQVDGIVGAQTAASMLGKSSREPGKLPNGLRTQLQALHKKSLREDEVWDGESLSERTVHTAVQQRDNGVKSATHSSIRSAVYDLSDRATPTHTVKLPNGTTIKLEPTAQPSYGSYGRSFAVSNGTEKLTAVGVEEAADTAKELDSRQPGASGTPVSSV